VTAEQQANREGRPESGAAPVAPAPDESTLLAVDRTRLAHERTLMAWIRTATSMISFGFTIYKFIEAQPGRERRFDFMERLLDARNFALLMISIGLIGLFFAALENHRELSALRATYGPARIPRSNAMRVAILVAVFGFVALGAVFVGPGA
jgi:inner membrane protein YidH